MNPTRLQFITTLLIAMMLHGALVAWMSLPDAQPQPPLSPKPQPQRTITLSVHMEVAEETVSEEPQPMAPPKPKPQRALAKPKPKPAPPRVEPTPIPEPQSAKPKPMEPPAEVVEVSPVPAPPTLRAPLDRSSTIRYEHLLVAWLEKYKQYPRRAKRLRIQGEATLRIRIDPFGNTTFVALERRTGNRMLDQAALEMARRASPFPPFPKGDPRTTLEFVVPVVFALR